MQITWNPFKTWKINKLQCLQYGQLEKTGEKGVED